MLADLQRIHAGLQTLSFSVHKAYQRCGNLRCLLPHTPAPLSRSVAVDTRPRQSGAQARYVPVHRCLDPLSAWLLKVLQMVLRGFHLIHSPLSARALSFDLQICTSDPSSMEISVLLTQNALEERHGCTSHAHEARLPPEAAGLATHNAVVHQLLCTVFSTASIEDTPLPCASLRLVVRRMSS